MKINKYNITFDSELELNFFEYLKEKGVPFKYNNEIKKPFNINLGRRKTYTPDFVVYDNDKKIIYILETKGYAKWSANEDNNICDFMKNKMETDEVYLINFLKENNAYKKDYKIIYERIKYLNNFGFVPYNFKNPNTIANKRKEKIETLENEIKGLKEEKITLEKEYKKEIKTLEKIIKNKDKDILRYLNYIKKEREGNILTKSQKEWKKTYEEVMCSGKR